ADGHPNLTRDPVSSLWVNSVFNPAANIDAGVNACIGFRRQMMTRFPGCTDTEYNLMSAGAFNSGAGSVTGCNAYNARAAMYVAAVLSHYDTFARGAHWPNPY